MSEPRDVWSLDLKPIDDRVPAEIRMRGLLKAALRSHGLRCLRIARQPAGDQGNADAAPEAPTPQDHAGEERRPA
ncbi:MAG: hypothetical protein JWM57_489 [Phycisphaerales bacterium]|nr:hypothetical protein [Phycisphaerales bacterium]